MCECFAEHKKKNGNVECRVLTYGYCIGHKYCSTYKTKEQIENEKIECVRRLNSLPVEVRKHIKSKYNIKYI